MITNNRRNTLNDDIKQINNKIEQYRKQKGSKSATFHDEVYEDMMNILYAYSGSRNKCICIARTVTTNHATFKMIVSPLGQIILHYKLVNIYKEVKIDTRQMDINEVCVRILYCLEEVYNWKEIPFRIDGRKDI